MANALSYTAESTFRPLDERYLLINEIKYTDEVFI